MKKVITIGQYAQKGYDEDENNVKKYFDSYIDDIVSKIIMFERINKQQEIYQEIYYEFPIYYMPDWDNDEDIEGGIKECVNVIKKVREEIEEKLGKKLHNEMENRIKVFDFAQEISQNPDNVCKLSLKYLENLKSGGQCIDLIKNVSMIMHKKDMHLYLDSNTQILNYANLYQNTFTCEKMPEKGIRLSTSNYSPSYYAPNNKIMFITPNSEFVTKLEEILNKELEEVKKLEEMIHKGSYFVKAVDDYKNKRNMMYTRIFCQAIKSVGLGVEKTLKCRMRSGTEYKDIKPKKICANLNEQTHDNFLLTLYIIHTRNQTWKSKGTIEVIEGHPGKVFKECEIILGENIKIDYNTYVASIKGLTSVLYNHHSENPLQARKDFKDCLGIEVWQHQEVFIEAYLQEAIKYAASKWSLEKQAEYLSALLQQIPSIQFGDNLKYALSSSNPNLRREMKKERKEWGESLYDDMKKFLLTSLEKGDKKLHGLVLKILENGSKKSLRPRWVIKKWEKKRDSKAKKAETIEEKIKEFRI